MSYTIIAFLWWWRKGIHYGNRRRLGQWRMSETIIGIYATGNGVDSENRQNLTGLRWDSAEDKKITPIFVLW